MKRFKGDHKESAQLKLLAICDCYQVQFLFICLFIYFFLFEFINLGNWRVLYRQGFVSEAYMLTVVNIKGSTSHIEYYKETAMQKNLKIV